MAGSNRSPAPLNGQVPPQWGTPEGDAHAAPQAGPHVQGQYQQPHPNDALSRWTPPQQAYAQQPAYQHPQPGYAAPQQAYAPAQGYGHPPGQQQAPFGGYAQPDPYAQAPGNLPAGQPQAGYQAEALQRPGYANPYDRYAPPPAQQQFDPHGAAHPGHAYDPNQHPSHGQGYAQQPHAQPAAEMQQWDLANYAPGQPVPGQGGQSPGAQQAYAAPFDQAPFGRTDAYPGPQAHDARYAQPAWPGQSGPPQGAAAYDLDRYAQPAQQQGYAPQPGYGQQGYAPEMAEGQAPDQDFAYEDEEPVAEKRRGPRLMVVAGALVGAILVGGGLAKGYQMLGGGGRDTGQPPIVKADKSPAKMKPTDAGGKNVDYTDKKFLNRLENAGGGSSVASASDVAPVSDPDAPRKVPTMVVSRDGTIAPQMAAPTSAASPAPMMPGMVVDGLSPASAPLRNAPVTAEPSPTPVVRQAPAVARVADLPLPKVKSDAAATSPVPPKKKVAVRDDLKAGTATTTAASASSGYVAALISTKTKEEALKTFANLHQTYAELQDKVPDVREIDRGEKGVWHRLIVGPPSSKEAALDLCKKLKGQGLKDCWVTAY